MCTLKSKLCQYLEEESSRKGDRNCKGPEVCVCLCSLKVGNAAEIQEVKRTRDEFEEAVKGQLE